MNDVAIKVDRVSKTFKLPHERAGSVKNALVNFARRKKGYEIQQVLKNVSFEVNQGEFFGIVGRNGSGKSTLLKILAGIYTPTEGNVQVNGKLTPFIELGVGFNPELTGRENVYLNGALLGFNRGEMEAMYDGIVAFAELEKFMDQKLKNYSSGMQVRLAFSIAIRAQTDILLLDEVLAVGDEAFQRKCYEYFEDLKRNKKTVILVTHDMGAVEKFCDRAILIEKGEIKIHGKANVVAKAYSQLFEETAEDEAAPQVAEEEKKRWGDGSLRVDTIEVDAGDRQRISMDLSVVCNTKVDRTAYISYTVKAAEGRSLFGEGCEANFLRRLEPGERSDLRLSFLNLLSKGKYYVDVSIRYDNNVYADFWSDCTVFRVKHDQVNGLSILADTKLTEL